MNWTLQISITNPSTSNLQQEKKLARCFLTFLLWLQFWCLAHKAMDGLHAQWRGSCVTTEIHGASSWSVAEMELAPACMTWVVCPVCVVTLTSPTQVQEQYLTRLIWLMSLARFRRHMLKVWQDQCVLVFASYCWGVRYEFCIVSLPASTVFYSSCDVRCRTATTLDLFD